MAAVRIADCQPAFSNITFPIFGTADDVQL